MKETSQNTRSLMAVVLVAAGIFMLAAAPFLVQSTLDPMLDGLVKKAAQDPGFASGPVLMANFYSLWRALIFVAGVAVIVIAYPLWQGEEWTWPAALACMAIPSIGGMYMMLPFVTFVKGVMPPSMIITLVGLAGYFAQKVRKGAPSDQLSCLYPARRDHNGELCARLWRPEAVDGPAGEPPIHQR